MNRSQLQSILTAHGLWVTSGGTKGERANLQGANLRHAYLHEAYLRGADLRGADLRRADLRGAKFTLEIRECYSFEGAQVSEDQLPWLVLHPRFGEWVKGLRIGQ